MKCNFFPQNDQTHQFIRKVILLESNRNYSLMPNRSHGLMTREKKNRSGDIIVALMNKINILLTL